VRKVFATEVDTENNKNVSAIQTKSATQQKKEVISITSDELLLLSKLITGEARGESYEGQVAVAAVVINRVKDPRFPKTIKDVIYQQNAFSVVKDGSINMQPTENAYRAAEEAVYGLDPTNKAVYFWNPDIATCQWIRTLDPYMRIGNHVFAK
jgi:N-acetylmuramoyl-L-alanine amidase